MPKCKFKKWGWECPLQSLPGEDYCYWHKEEDGKNPDNAMLKELKDNDIKFVFLRKAELIERDLEKANLEGANLEGAYLGGANLQGANLRLANLEGANLTGVIADSGTILDGANLTYANLYLSYLDGTKTLRNARFEDKREINEIVADLLKKSKDFVLDVEKIKLDDPKVASKLFEKGLVRYVLTTDKIVFFNREKKVVRIPYKMGKIQRLFRKGDSKEGYEISELNDLIKKNGVEKYLYKGSREELYEASYEVYNNLYYFYIQNGRLEDALDMHYRRGEVRRKLLNERGGIDRFRSWIYDFFILKILTGYGVKISRPLIASALIISIFAFLFWLTKGIIKEVNGVAVTPDIWDYLYHSVITFTSLGYSNIQPNLAAGHIPQLLVAIESFLGVLMMALLIFVITYRVSR